MKLCTSGPAGTGMGGSLWVGRPSWYVAACTGQLSLGHPLWVVHFEPACMHFVAYVTLSSLLSQCVRVRQICDVVVY